MSSWRDELKQLLPAAKIDEPLARYTTFKIGGPADAYLEIGTVADLAEAVRFARDRRLPLTMLGFGSNVLVRDGGVRGIVIRLAGDFDRIEFLARDRVHAGAAVRVPHLVSQCAERGLGGDESLVGIPGAVGGALVMNAGTREGEIGALVESVDAFDEARACAQKLPRSELEFSYRSSNLGSRIVVGATLQLKPGDKRVIMTRVQQFQQKRRQTQPIHTFNVGSTFKNPPGRFAAQLIEEAGLKGLACGGARISPMHANFMENFSGAKASDVLELVETARSRVRERFGVELELEMKLIGEKVIGEA